MRVSLDHAHLFASDVAATVRFFESMLGARVVWDEEAAGVRNVRLKVGRGFVQLYDQPPKGTQGVVHHLGIETDDLDALVGRMQAAGVTFRTSIRELPKFRYVMVAGPDNLLLELFECREPQRWEIEP
jgi:catechol 2,3-dioxygenase-like lactoylglutathione lyase family enzyme